MTPMLRHRLLGLVLALTAAGCLSQGRRITPLATAKEIESAADLIGGPNATGQVGDFLLQNERIRVVIQAAGRAGRTPYSYGGNAVDVDRVRFPGEQGGDRFGGSTLVLNGVRTVKPERVFVLEDGSATGYAIVRVEGDDAPLNGLTWRRYAELVSREVHADFSPDTDLDLIVKTDYILRPGANFVEVRTTFVNRRSAATRVVVGDMLDYGSTRPFLSGAKGFALPGVDDDYGAVSNTVFFEGEGISYGYHLGRLQYVQAADDRAKAAWAETAVWVPMNGLLANAVNFASFTQAVNPGEAEEEQLIKVPGAGSATFSRYLLVGQGDAGELVEAVNAAHDRDSEYVAGAVTTRDTAGNTVPAAGADVAVLQGGVPIAHLTTDANGQFRGAMLPGTFEFVVNMAGHPYKNDKPEIQVASFGRKANRTQSLDFFVEPAARLRLFVKDMTLAADVDGNVAPIEGPLPAHVALSRDGGDPSPAMFSGQAGDVYPFRPEESLVVTVDPSGELALDVEPGDYEFYAYHGPAYSMARAAGELRAGKRTDRVMELARVVGAEGVLQAEFTGRTLRSGGTLDTAARIVRAFAEGVELLVVADDGARTDTAAATDLLDELFSPSGQDPRPITRQIAAAPGERVDTQAAGSFSAWPVYPGRGAMGGGLAWDRGDDVDLTPAEIIDALLGLPADAAYAEDTGISNLPAPFVSVDRPFGEPGTADLGYFDAADPVVDWALAYDDGAVAGKAGLWTDKWNGLNVFASADEAVFWLGANSYFALLNIGAKPDAKLVPQVTALAGSVDTAEVVSAAGTARNLVRSPVTEVRRLRCAVGEAVCADAVQALAAVNAELAARRNVVSNGPWLSLEVTSGTLPVKRAKTGELLDLYPNDVAHFYVAVTTPCWAQVDRIEIYSNTTIEAPAVVNGALAVAPAPVSTFTTAAFTTRTVVDDRTGLADAAACRADGTGAGRVEITLAGALAMPRDAWVVAVARGSSASPFAAKPLAMTNAVFVETEGDGKFGPVCPGAACPNTGKSRLGWFSPARAETFR